jgi:uncharacterized repeat protein (TIGR01451 family)
MKKTTPFQFWKPALVVGMATLFAGCQSRQLSWLGAESSPTRMMPHTRATPPQALASSPTTSRPQEQVSNRQALAGTKQTTALGEQSKNDVVQVQYTQPVGEPFATAVPREPMGVPMGPSMGPHAGYAPGYQGVGYQGAGCPTCGPTAMTNRSYALHSHRNHPGRTYQPVFSQMDGSCAPCTSSSVGTCGPSEDTFAIPRDSDPQEYIFDGGDREPTVHVRKDNSQAGLDPEDTIIQYETIDGKIHAESGCRVAIYAPRFGSVRKRTNPIQSDVSTQVGNIAMPDGVRMARNQLPPMVERNRTKPILDTNVRIVEGLKQGAKPIPTESIISPQIMIDQQTALTMLSLFQTETLKIKDKQALESAILAAQTWGTAEEIDVLVNGQETMSVLSSQEQSGVTHYERKGSRMRLCKIASEQMAHPGDTITFTIRFDNVGETPVSSLVVTDSLAPRLEYIPDSQRSTLEADFVLTPNIAGSEILRWEFKKELPAGQGGLISFDCKVR